MAALQGLSGFVFKSRSPSCGLNSTPVFIEGQVVELHSRGIFARYVTRNFPGLPVIEECDFELQGELDHFIENVKQL